VRLAHSGRRRGDQRAHRITWAARPFRRRHRGLA
jgi:hypothetical protein